MKAGRFLAQGTKLKVCISLEWLYFILLGVCCLGVGGDCVDGLVLLLQFIIPGRC